MGEVCIIRDLSHFLSTKRRSYLWRASFCCVKSVFSLFPLSLSSGRLTTGLFWRWTGIQSMTSYCQVEKTVNIRWAVFDCTFRHLGGVLNLFFSMFKPCPLSTGMGQLWPTAFLLLIPWLPNNFFVLGTRRRGVFCGLLQHSAALWQDWSKNISFTFNHFLIFKFLCSVTTLPVECQVTLLHLFQKARGKISRCHRRFTLFHKVGW